MLVAVSFVLLPNRVFSHRQTNQTPHGIARALAQFFSLTVFLGLCCGLCLALCGIISRCAGAVGCAAVYSAVGVCGGGLRARRVA